MKSKNVDKYVIVQVVIIMVIFFSAPFGRMNLHTGVVIIGIILLCVGAIIVAIAFKHLGSALTPAVRPAADGKLITTGIYSIVRHPMYFGVILLAVGWSIGWGSFLAFMFSIVLAVFFAFKAQEEEKLLNEKYPEYVDYKARVKKKIIPYIY